MKKTLWLDYETRSVVDLEVAGVHNYATSPSTKVLLIAYAIDNSEVTVLEHIKSPIIPQELMDAWYDPDTEIVCWNTTFERLISRYCLWLKIPIERFLDAMIISRHCSLPGNLEKCCDVLKLGADSKIDGDKLKALFCYPQHLGGELTLFGISEPRFADWNSHPTEWSQFKEYVKYDVISMRKICKLLKNHPLPQSEIEGFWLDQKINDHGVPVDLDLIQKMDKIAQKAKDIANKKIIEITGVENPNSRPQLLKWLKEQHYPFNSLGKPFVNASLDDLGMTSAAEEVLVLRKESSKTSDGKLESLKYAVSPDGYVRDLFGYLGASRTGRWNSHGPQFANQPRPEKAVEKNFDLALELFKLDDFVGLKALAEKNHLSVMDFVAGCIRACYRAPAGDTFVIADYASIEPRILGWISGCGKINEMFRRGEDCYLKFAEPLFGIPYAEMVQIVDGKHECKPEYKLIRQQAKPGFLGCGYMLSGGEEKLDKNSDIYKTGVWGYAASMGVDLPYELAHKAVRVFRSEYKEVCEFWYQSEDAIKESIRTRKKIQLGHIFFDMVGKTLRMGLPSGRFLHYVNPKIEQAEFRGKMKDQITFEGIEGKTKQWLRQPTHPGRTTENAVSSIARDVLLDGLKRADKAGLRICAHVHDEIVCVTNKSDNDKLKVLLNCMKTSPVWAKNLLIDAEGFISERYKKS